ncbi:TRAP transporter small permease subunit [Wenxinia marina]|uniref:TRAP transporter small permease protein n=1 Tax=Wenxinia marina DSM 24838 TaxID=1123501 RepID=A0A0D0Q783_9RHOB|nr:TRAP transporter small permease [Wenxinia marina]KIQ70284.1 TRAP-type C4-dicarboxylate transport system, small permease component [Wenxinia marina DSM 24838]GGL49808.1 hypothetical protein GCM10011392_00070 [Wenxinia marina]
MLRLAHLLSHLLAAIAAFALLCMMLHVVADVAGKYLLNQPIPGTAEIVASYYMVTAVFLPLAWVELRDGSIVVELFYDRVPPRFRRGLLIVAFALTAAFYGGLGWLSWQPAMHAWRIGEVVEGTWRVVIWPTKFLLPFGLALAAAIAVLRCLMAIAGRDVLTPHAPADPV